MTEYIEREAVIKARHNCKRNCKECDFAIDGDSWCEGEVWIVDILRIPAADVVEERHGRWAITPDEWRRHCSICGQCRPILRGDYKWLYCPNCGAKMDGGHDE